MMAAAEATLLDVLTDEAYAQLHARQREADGRLRARHRRATACPRTRSAWAPRAASCSRREPVREYRDYLTKIHHDLTNLAWLYHMNNGIFMTPGEDEEWTLSVLHTDADLQRYVEVFETFARDVTSAG